MPPKMTVELYRCPPGDLHLYRSNPKRGDLAVLKASLCASGQYKPIVVNKGTHTGVPMEVLAGNHTLMAIRELAVAYPDDKRWITVLYHLVDVDNDQARRIVLVDNRSADLGTYDDTELANLLVLSRDADPDLFGTGYTPEDLDKLLSDVTTDVDIPDPDVDVDGKLTTEAKVFTISLPVPWFEWLHERFAEYREDIPTDSDAAALVALVGMATNRFPPKVDVR